MPDIQIRVAVVGADQAVGQLQRVGTAAQNAGRSASSAGGGMLSFAGKAAGAATGVLAVTNGLFQMQDAFSDVERADLRASVARRKAGESLEKVQKIQEKMNGTMQDTTKTVNTNNGAIGQETDHILSYNKATGEAVVQTRTANGEMVRQTKSMKGQIPTQDDLNDAIAKYNDDQDRAVLLTGEAAKAHQRLGTSVAGGATSMGLGALAAVPFVGELIKMFTGGTQAAKGVSGAAEASTILGAETTGATGGLRGLATGLVSLPGPLKIVGAAAAAVVVGAIALHENWFGVRDAANSAGEAMGKAIPAAKPLLNFVHDTAEALGIIPGDASKAGAAVGTAFSSAGKAIATIPAAIVALPKTIVQGADAIGTAILDALAKVPGQIGPALSGVGAAIGKWAATLPGTLAGGAVAIGGAILNWFKDVGPKIPGILAEVAVGIIKWVAALPGNIAAGAVAIGTAITGWFTGLFPKISAKLGEIATGIAQWIAGIPGWLAGGAVAIGTAIAKWFTELPGKIAVGASTLASEFLKWISGIPGWLAGGAVAVATAIGSWILNVGSKLFEGGFKIAIELGKWIAGIPGWLAGGAIAIGTAIGQWILNVGSKLFEGGFKIAVELGKWIAGIPGWLAGGAIAIGTAIANWIVNVGSSLLGGTLKLATEFGKWVAGIPGWLAGGAVAIGQAILNWVTGIGSSLFAGALKLATELGKWVAGIPGWLAGGAIAIGTAIGSWVLNVGSKLFEGGFKIAVELGKWVAGIPGWLAGGAIAIATAIGSWILNVGSKLFEGGFKIAVELGKWVEGIPGWLAGGAIAIATAVGHWALNAGSSLFMAGFKLATEFGNWVEGIPQWLAGGAEAIGKAIAGWAANIPAAALDLGRKIGNAIGGAINGALKGLGLPAMFTVGSAQGGSFILGPQHANAVQSAINKALALMRAREAARGPSIGELGGGTPSAPIGGAISQALYGRGVPSKTAAGAPRGPIISYTPGGARIVTIPLGQPAPPPGSYNPSGGTMANQGGIRYPYQGATVTPVQGPGSDRFLVGGVLAYAGVGARGEPTYNQVNTFTPLATRAKTGGLFVYHQQQRQHHQQQHAARGGSFIADHLMTFGNLTVGEGRNPELLTLIPFGRGGGILNVTPLKGPYAPHWAKGQKMREGGDTWINNSHMFSGLTRAASRLESHGSADRLIALLQKLISLQIHGGKSLEANLFVDGQRMAANTQRYLGSKSYGDR